jgi:phosphoserine phosphatase
MTTKTEVVKYCLDHETDLLAVVCDFVYIRPEEFFNILGIDTDEAVAKILEAEPEYFLNRAKSQARRSALMAGKTVGQMADIDDALKIADAATLKGRQKNARA